MDEKNVNKKVKKTWKDDPNVQVFNNFEEFSKKCDFMSDDEKELFHKCVGDNAEYAIF